MVYHGLEPVKAPRYHSDVKGKPKASTSHRRSQSPSMPPPLDLTGQIEKLSQGARGGGGFADVHKALWKKENVAVKVLRWHLDDENDRVKKKKRLHREIRVWQRLEHCNILPLYGVTLDFGVYPSMVCPWLEKGDLNRYLSRYNDTLTLLERFYFLCGICDGLEYLHSRNVVHGDLTGSNILITADGKPCLCDFGLSKIMAEFEGTSYLTGTGGAVRWAAFELYHMYGDGDEPHSAVISTESDIYSFGSVMLQMLSGKVPYHYIRAQAAVVILVHSGTLPRRDMGVPGLNDDEVWGFINMCWASPTRRPSISEVSNFVHQYHARLVSSRSELQTMWSDPQPIKVIVDPPLVRNMIPITALRGCYEQKHPFISQINWLIDSGRDHVRQMGEDGDSFYRSVGFAFIEQILQARALHQEVKRVVKILESTRFLLEVAGFQTSMFEDLLVILISIVQQIVTPDLNGETLTSDILLEAFQVPEVSNSVVLYLRLLTAAQIRADPETYVPYLIDFQLEPLEFCEHFVQEMGVSAGEVQVAALSSALGITVKVAQLQSRKVAQGKVEFVTYQTARAIEDSNPILLLNRSGHYELLYETF